MIVNHPNVVYIDCHDLGDWLGCYGRPYVRSPNIDFLAAQGDRFTAHFAGAPICGPSRICLYTSRTPHAVGVYGNAGYEPTGECIPMARWFSEHGYATYLCGSWKTNGTAKWAGYNQQTPYGPDSPRVEEIFQELAAGNDVASRPFFLHFSFQLVHRPFGSEYDPGLASIVAVPGDMPDLPVVRYDLASLCRNVELLDEHVGRILAGLRDAGLDETTVTVFVTDHGAALARAKHTLYDAGLRTALIIRRPGPGASHAGRVHDELLSNLDLFPTLCELADIPTPSAAEGRSFAPLVVRDDESGRSGGSGVAHYTPRNEVFFEFTFGQRSGMQYYTPVRGLRTRRYKLIRSFTPDPFYLDSGWLARFERADRQTLSQWSLYGNETPPVQLYDIETDPLERVNLATEVAWLTAADNRSLLDEFLARLERHLREGGDELLSGSVSTKKDSPVVQQWVRPENSDRYKLHNDPCSESAEAGFPEIR